MILAELGTLSYNGYHFDGTSKVSVNVELAKDDAGRTVVGHQHTIHVWTLIQGDSGTNTEMLAIRQQLGEQGRELTFINRGFGGDLVVNTSNNGMRDIRWGPIPKIIHWEPIASYRCSEMEWEVITTLPICDNGVQRWSGVMALNYEVSFDIDERGYTSRSITGYLEIAQTRIGRTIPDSADLYLNSYLTTIPLGFKRSQSRHLSLNKSRLDFSIIDKQIPSPNAFPAGIIDIQVRHRAGWKRGSGLPRNVITAEIEVAAHMPPAYAMVVFSSIANQRLAIARAAAVIADSTSGGQTNAIGSVLLDEFTIEEDLFSRRSSFTLGYLVPASLKQFITSCGLWASLPTTWLDWHTSINEAQSQRGYAGLNHLPADDRITDLCQPANLLGYAQRQNPYNQIVQPTLPAIKNVRPTPKNSWLKYHNNAIIHRQRPVVRQRLLQPTDTDPGTFDPQATTGMLYPQGAGLADVIQEGGRGSYYAMLSGRAARAGWEIPRPKYGTIGGAPATEIDGIFRQAITGNWFGCPIYQATWELVYALPYSPGKIIAFEPNPEEFLNGDGTAQA